MCPCGPDSGRIWPFSTPTGVCAERAPVSNFVKKKQVSSGSFVILSELQSLVVPFCEQMSQKGTGYPSRQISGWSFFYMTSASRPGGTVWGLVCGGWDRSTVRANGWWKVVPGSPIDNRGSPSARGSCVDPRARPARAGQATGAPFHRRACQNSNAHRPRAPAQAYAHK